jgi:hypothetical protein
MILNMQGNQKLCWVQSQKQYKEFWRKFFENVEG